MISPNIETVLGCDSSYRAADIVLYGAPYDSTTSYRPGARFDQQYEQQHPCNMVLLLQTHQKC